MGLGTTYLILYNFVQFVGWSTLLGALTLQVVAKENYDGVYEVTGLLLNIFQTAAVLEVLHAIVGLVRSNPVLTGFQVYSRVFLTWGVFYSVKQVQTTEAVPITLLAWSVTEIIRYSFYTCGLLGQVPYMLSWCRYTFFIILYPIGVLGELLGIYYALPVVQKTGLYTIPLPNITNMSFDYYSFLIFTMLMYIPIFPQLYCHMFRQRRKVLSTPAEKKTD